MENIMFHSTSRPPPSLPSPSKLHQPPQIPSKPITLSPIIRSPKVKNFSRDAHLKSLCRKGRIVEATTVLDAIAQQGLKVRPDTFTQLLQSCIDSNSIHLGRKLHAWIGLLSEPDPFVDTKLVSMYAKCGYLEDARNVFDRMPDRNLYTWSAMIGACLRECRWGEVVNLFFLMMKDGVVPDEFLIPKILQACGNCGDIETVKLVHSLLIKDEMFSCIHVSNAVLTAYAKCGRLKFTRSVFDKMDDRDSVTWNSIIYGYCQNGDFEEARSLFHMMCHKGFVPGLVTWNILIASYSQSGDCDVALKLMKDMAKFGVTPDVYTWTSLISGFGQNNRRNHALQLFKEMLQEGVEPSEITVISAISVCASCKAQNKGKELHTVAIKIGFVEDVLVGNSLINMYSKCGELEDAWQVFDKMPEKDVYTWNSMIGGYCYAGYRGKAHSLFIQMHKSDVQPNVVTWNLMISGYMQNRDEDQAITLFQKMEKSGLIQRNTASWNCLIAGYIRNGLKDEALGIFRKMQSLYCKPNSVTILSVLPVCANLIAAKKIKEIFGCVLRMNLVSSISVPNSLIDTFAKSGNLKYSKRIFGGLSLKDVISWNSVIAGYVLHGLPNEALGLFTDMGKVGLKPTRSTFVSIIRACGLAGLVDEGKRLFVCMTDDYQILPGLEHYAAMVELFGRTERLEEAAMLIQDMAIEPDSSIWASLLTASQMNGNIELAVHAGERLLELEPENLLVCRLLLQSYVLREKLEDASKIRELERRKGSNYQAWSCIEVENKVYVFEVGHQSKLNTDLQSWIKRLVEEGKVPDSHDGFCIEEDEKEDLVGVHSEKLACAFALIGSSHPSKIIHIVKNLRMCRSCHNTFKYISMAFGCEIYLKDSKTLHVFTNGSCSCGDYW